MKLQPFALESYYKKYEFKTKYMLSSSDAESWSLTEILSLASKQELHMWNSQRFGYTEIKGLPLLREAIVDELYPNLSADNILCFSGAEEGIFCALLAICSSNDHAIVLTPCYQSLGEIPRAIGCAVTEIALTASSDWRIDISAIARAIKHNTRAVIINFPHNPTGQVITQKELVDLVGLLREKDIWLFSDEVYRLLGQPNVAWSKPAATVYSKALSLGVMSKAYGFPGLRIGWIACQDERMLQKIEQIKEYTTICNSGPSEILSLIAMRNSACILKRNNDLIALNMKYIDMFFDRYASLFSWVRPAGGCVGFVEYLPAKSVDELCLEAIQQAQVLLLPGSVYGSPRYFRMGYGRRNFPEALERFTTFIEDSLL